MPIKLRQRRYQPIELPRRNRAFLERALERLAPVETPHHHQPVNDIASSADREAARTPPDRDYALIHIGGELVVQREFGAASCLSPRKSREIEVRKLQRLLELENLFAGEENPRHMGL